MDIQKIITNPLILGMVGSLVAAVKFAPGLSFPERIFNIGAGTIAAATIAPALIEWLALNRPVYESLASFICGLLFMSLAGAIIENIKKLPLADIFTSWTKRKGGGE